VADHRSLEIYQRASGGNNTVFLCVLSEKALAGPPRGPLVRAKAVPPGVPVTMTTPGLSGMLLEKKWITCGRTAGARFPRRTRTLLKS